MSFSSKLSTFLLSAIVFATACGGTAPQPATDTAADTAAINNVRSQYQNAYNAGDASALAALYSDDAVLLPDHHAAVEGKSALQQYFQETFAQYTLNLTIMPGDTEITGALAHEHGTFSMTATPKAGGNAMTDNGKYLVILKRQPDGMWKIHHDIDNSSNPPPPMPSQAGKR